MMGLYFLVGLLGAVVGSMIITMFIAWTLEHACSAPIRQTSGEWEVTARKVDGSETGDEPAGENDE